MIIPWRCCRWLLAWLLPVLAWLPGSPAAATRLREVVMDFAAGSAKSASTWRILAPSARAARWALLAVRPVTGSTVLSALDQSLSLRHHRASGNRLTTAQVSILPVNFSPHEGEFLTGRIDGALRAEGSERLLVIVRYSS